VNFAEDFVRYGAPFASSAEGNQNLKLCHYIGLFT